MPVRVRWSLWWLCFTAFVFLVQLLIPTLGKIALKWRVLISIILCFAFAASMWPVAKSQWREEMAAVLVGDLTGAGAAISDDKPHGFPMLQVGETTWVMTPNGVADIFPFFPDSGVRIEWGLRGPLFSTHVRDRNGNLVAEVTRNHWRVYPLYSAEKNYTEDALEVEDSAGHVVLQVRISPDRIRLQGEWWDTQGNGIRLVGVRPPAPGGSLVVRLNRQNQSTESLVQPIFQYPSRDHWGEFQP